MTWNPLVNTDYWSLKLKKVYFGDLLLVTSASKAIIDSGTSLLAMPDLEFNNMIETVRSEYNYNCFFDDFNRFYACDCTREQKENFPPLNITLSESNTY